MDHLEISERLPAYLAGELDAGTKAGIEEHVATCVQCSEELVALEHLARADAPALSEIERARLHREVGDAFGRPRHEPRTPWFARVAPAVAAVALVALGAVVAANVWGGGDAGDGGSAEIAGDAAGQGKKAGGEPEPEAATAPEAAGPEDIAGGGGAGDGQADEDSLRSIAGSVGPIVFEKVGGVDRDGLARLGRKTVRATRFTALLDNGSGKARRYTSKIARRAPAGLRDQVRLCDRIARRRTGAIVATYGARATFDHRASLILGFVYPASLRKGGGRYTMWAWPLGSCSAPLDVAGGQVKP